MMDGKISEARFEDAIRYNRRRPDWFIDTPYNPEQKVKNAIATAKSLVA